MKKDTVDEVIEMWHYTSVNLQKEMIRRYIELACLDKEEAAKGWLHYLAGEYGLDTD